MIKTQMLSWKIIEGNSNRKLRVRIRLRFLLFYSELTQTSPPPPPNTWCNMLRDFTWTEKNEEAMSDEQPLHKTSLFSCCYSDDGYWNVIGEI